MISPMRGYLINRRQPRQEIGERVVAVGQSDLEMDGQRSDIGYGGTQVEVMRLRTWRGAVIIGSEPGMATGRTRRSFDRPARR